jgi:hypothetical protein
MASRKATTEEKAARKLPTSENGHGVHYITKSGREYCVSHCVEKGRFTLWRIVPNGYIKLTSAMTPQELYPVADADKS